MSEKRNVVVAGAVVALAVAAIAVYFFTRPSTPTDKPSSKAGKSAGKEKVKSVKPAKPEPEVAAPRTVAPSNDTAGLQSSAEEVKQTSTVTAAPTTAASAPVVDEADSDSDDEAELAKRYDDSLRLAKKFLQGERYIQAAAKFTEAIDLAPRIPSASKDILTLYNNRSAMYEKQGDLDASLKDITIVLTMDFKHLKARARRARIYERQGQFEDALRDAVFCSVLEGASGIPQTNAAKIVEYGKHVAAPEVLKVVQRIRTGEARGLPNKAFCRNFFESFATFHQWKMQFEDTNRDALMARSYEEPAAQDKTAAVAELKAIMELVKLDLSQLEFSKGFAHLPRAQALVVQHNLGEHAPEDVLILIALLEDLLGAEMHLKCSLVKAVQHYQTSLKVLTATDLGAGAGAAPPLSEEANNVVIETSLKLASVYVELGENVKAAEIYNSVLLLAKPAADGSPHMEKAWILIHQVILHVSRDDAGNFNPEGLKLAIADLEEVLKLTGSALLNGASAVDIHGRVCALLKLVHVLSQTKVQMGQQPTEAEIEKVSGYIQEAKQLAPGHESVILLDADLLSMNGDNDQALERCDEVILSSDGTDSIPYVIKANILMQKSLAQMQIAQQQSSQQMLAAAQETMQEVEKIFQEAIRIEPNGLEAFAQYSQLKSMMGELDLSLEYIEKALINVRSKDEVQELCVMKAQTLAQLAALEEYKTSSQP